MYNEFKEYYESSEKDFSKRASTYDWIEIMVARTRHRIAKMFTGKKLNVLDLCTGTGRQAMAFARVGHDVVGIDMSEDMLYVASKRNKYNNILFKKGDATNLNAADNSFDLVSISYALHDMPVEIQEKVLAEARRVAKPDGEIILIDHSLPDNKILKFLIYNFNKIYETHYYKEFVKNDNIAELIKNAGISISSTKYTIFGAVQIIRCFNS